MTFAFIVSILFGLILSLTSNRVLVKLYEIKKIWIDFSIKLYENDDM